MRALVELTKPGITRMVLVTTAAGFYLASPGAVDWLLLGVMLVGTGLVASAAGALNQWAERDADGMMVRTHRRPLPSGRLDRSQALVFAAVLACTGLAVTGLAVGIAPAVVVALSLITYLWLYTPLKRRTWWATIVGAVPGGLPILAGWMAAGGGLDGAGLALFSILFLWQMPHFYALAWIYRDDYLRGGFRLLSADDPTGLRTARQAVAFAVLLVPVSLLPTRFGVSGQAYLAGALALGLAYAALGLALLIRRNNRRAWRLFFASVVYLPALLLLMVLDKLAV
jgi:protoheme IX farnesyltransferase